eukprot:TRINITY_DN25393_c0_g2_i2.p1 TRINITY_DN25393_c0_g2~~TRINITY_DN25393_c0_g2_i2.p1  ORF type:complete len:364 (+),score=76.40 TRINITY_DN25393_c0_g2_i2:71-1093(+)
MAFLSASRRGSHRDGRLARGATPLVLAAAAASFVAALSWSGCFNQLPPLRHARPAARSRRSPAAGARGRGRLLARAAAMASSSSGRRQYSGDLPYDGMTELTEADLECLEERHLFLRQRGVSWDLQMKTVGSGHRCKHGWPQAVMYDPIWASGKLGDTVRLTCPLLVAAINAYESTGAITRYNERMHNETEWRQQLTDTNWAHRNLRRQLINGREAELEEARERMGEETVAIIMETGLASMSLNSSDVKCLHAQVADQLTRGKNLIGEQVLLDLQERGVDVLGTDCCCDHCNVAKPLEEARWQFKEAKNHLGKRMRKLQKMWAQEAAAVEEAATVDPLPA